MGRRKRFVRSGKEPATKAQVSAACAGVTRVQGIKTVPGHERRGDQDADGLAESATTEVKTQARSVKSALERLRDESVAPEPMGVPFRVMHGAPCLNQGGGTPAARRRMSRAMVSAGTGRWPSSPSA